MSARSSKKRSLVAVFDFDWSFINENSDTWVFSLLSQASRDELKQDRQRFPVWTDFMDHAFDKLHQEGVTEERLRSHLATIPVFPEIHDICRLLTSLTDRTVSLYIVSDANTFLIHEILSSLGLLRYFSSDRILTNPSKFDETGRLRVHYHHLYEHDCPRCPRNMCKGAILKGILQNHETPQILYLGDGGGDLCPCLQLQEGDHIMARRDFALHQQITAICAAQFPPAYPDFLSSPTLSSPAAASSPSIRPPPPSSFSSFAGAAGAGAAAATRYAVLMQKAEGLAVLCQHDERLFQKAMAPLENLLIELQTGRTSLPAQGHEVPRETTETDIDCIDATASLVHRILNSMPPITATAVAVATSPACRVGLDEETTVFGMVTEEEATTVLATVSTQTEALPSSIASATAHAGKRGVFAATNPLYHFQRCPTNAKASLPTVHSWQDGADALRAYTAAVNTDDMTTRQQD